MMVFSSAARRTFYAATPLKERQLVALGDSPGTVRAIGPGDLPIGTVVSIEGWPAVIAIDGFCGGSYVVEPTAAMPSPAARRIQDECRHCGCPFPENPCHFCGMRTRR